MATINAKIQLRSDTEANWTSANPTLLAGEIAVSSDQLHAGTDQPKFKIGNGTSAWADLDYYPVGGAGATPTLEDVRAEGNSISGTITGAAPNTGNFIDLNNTDYGGVKAIMKSGNAVIVIGDSQVYISDASGVAGCYVNTISGLVQMYNDYGTLTLNADGTISAGTNIIKDLATPVLSTDAANKAYADTKQTSNANLTTIAGLTPSDNDVIQRKSGAWTNRTIAQYYSDLQSSVKADVFVSTLLSFTSISPADSTTYYIGYAGIPRTTQADRDFPYPVTGIITDIDFYNIPTGVNGSADASTLYFENITQATSVNLGTFYISQGANMLRTNSFSGLSIAVTKGDDCVLRWDSAAWATNPTNVIGGANIICKRS